jgi:CRISPR-associated endonuclease/helicase Cas3
VAELAAEFAAPFGAAEWGRKAGLWHDLGKYSDAFQAYLASASTDDGHVAEIQSRIDHATAGAQHAASCIEVLGHLLAFVIAGHHSGLLDARSDRASLEKRLAKAIEPYSGAPPELLDAAGISLPAFLSNALSNRAEAAFTFAFFTRMLFSCLVDADFLATEEFLRRDQSEERPAWPVDVLATIERLLETRVAELGGAADVVDRARADVRAACLEAARREPGLFSLTAPTGGGKTLSSLAFALRHAQKHGLRRIVYVVPFTTIIEQTCQEFRRIVEPLLRDGGADPIVEHHSNFDPSQETTLSRLVTENWDAPLIVTTSVQFFESLFASRTSRCRKLHRLSRSVIILDEAQTLPVDLLQPSLRALQELAENYGSTVVLCTATQPAIDRRPEFPIGLRKVREIVPDRATLYRDLKRVEVKDQGRVTDAELAERLAAADQVLCIVNTRGHARSLFELLGPGEGSFHLSALMCSAHRSQVIAEIRDRLASDRTCRVVSTQLIEAGIDIDFPMVYRSLAGLDSIAQAAGRCNRSGRLPGGGATIVFRSEHDRSERFVSDTAGCAAELLGRYDDLLSLEAVDHYFRLYYWEQKARWDSKGILGEFHLLNDHALPFLFGFDTVGQRFRLNEVAVPWGADGRALCEELRDPRREPNRDLLRRIQRYSVRIPSKTWAANIGGALELLRERFAVLVNPEMHYSEQLGICLDRQIFDPLLV